MADRTELDAMLAITSLAKRESVDSGDRGAFMALPEGYEVHALENFQGRPNRIVARPTMRTAASLAAYVNRFREAGTVLFSSPGNREVYAHIDYHDATTGNEAGGENARFCSHTATYTAIYSAEYAAWRAIFDRPMSQVDAGEFLEERATDVIEPGAADIMDMVMQFDALKKVTFRQSTRLHSGERQLTYTEENEARGAVTLPEAITIRVPVFDGMEPDRLKVRVRYRINDEGRLRFSFLLHDRQAIEDQAFYRCEDAVMAGITGDAPPLFRTAGD